MNFQILAKPAALFCTLLVWWGKQHERHQLKFRFYTMIVTQWSSGCGCLSSNPCHAAGGVWWGKQNVVTQWSSKNGLSSMIVYP
jgi:hypothetical protein